MTKTNLVLGDCEEGMKKIKNGSVDVIVTSPPYNLGIKYGAGFNDNLNEHQYLQKLKNVAAEMRRVLTHEGSLFLNIAGSPSKPMLPYLALLALTGEDCEFILQNTFHWIKSAAVPIKKSEGTKMKTIGHFKPINSKRYVNDCHEFVFHLTKTGNVPLDRKAAGVPYEDKSNLTRWEHTEGADLRCRGNNWFIPYKTISSRDKDRPHPATFPPELPLLAMKLHGKFGHALDPFLGLGNSGIAAAQAGFKTFTGFELDPVFLKEAENRIRQSQI